MANYKITYIIPVNHTYERIIVANSDEEANEIVNEFDTICDDRPNHYYPGHELLDLKAISSSPDWDYVGPSEYPDDEMMLVEEVA